MEIKKIKKQNRVASFNLDVFCENVAREKCEWVNNFFVSASDRSIEKETRSKKKIPQDVKKNKHL